jgi:hypothetical protein
LPWARKLCTPALLAREPDRITQMIDQPANLYDGVPRGRAQTPPDQSSRCIVYHGNDALGIRRSRNPEPRQRKPAPARAQASGPAQLRPTSAAAVAAGGMTGGEACAGCGGVALASGAGGDRAGSRVVSSEFQERAGRDRDAARGGGLDIVFPRAGSPRKLIAGFAAVRGAFAVSRELAGLIG